MQFCPKCKKIMRPKRDNGTLVFECTGCGHVKKPGKADTKITTKTKEDEVELAVVDEKSESLPVVEMDCRKCGHDKAYFWSKQTRSGDEAETRFFRCVECGNTWREYD